MSFDLELTPSTRARYRHQGRRGGRRQCAAQRWCDSSHGVLDLLGGIDILVNVLGGSNSPAGGFAALEDEAWAKGYF